MGQIHIKSGSKSRIIYDPAKHGYDGYMGHYRKLQRAMQKKLIFCDKSPNENFDIYLAFQYELDDQEYLDFEKEGYPKREIFGWFAIYVQPAGGLLERVAEFESN